MYSNEHGKERQTLSLWIYRLSGGRRLDGFLSGVWSLPIEEYYQVALFIYRASEQIYAKFILQRHQQLFYIQQKYLYSKLFHK